LFDHAPGFMAVLRGPDHVFEMMNPATSAGGHRDLIGKRARCLSELEDRVLVGAAGGYTEPARSHGHSSRSSCKAAPTARPRSISWISCSQPIIESDGRVSGIFAEGYDTTERSLAEIAARESEERVPPDRGFGAGADVGHSARPQAELRHIAYAEFLGVSYEDALTFDWRDRILRRTQRS
jgi:hypothetical protein